MCHFTFGHNLSTWTNISKVLEVSYSQNHNEHIILLKENLKNAFYRVNNAQTNNIPVDTNNTKKLVI